MRRDCKLCTLVLRPAPEFSVVAADLRGYGDSSKPPSTPDHSPYTKRAMVIALWSKHGKLPAWYDVLAVWREWADDVRGHALDCGHFLPEEAPDATYRAIRDFLAA